MNKVNIPVGINFKKCRIKKSIQIELDFIGLLSHFLYFISVFLDTSLNLMMSHLCTCFWTLCVNAALEAFAVNDSLVGTLYASEVLGKWKDLVFGTNLQLCSASQPCVRLTLTVAARRCCCCFNFHDQHFSIFLPTLTPADSAFLGSGLQRWAKEGTGGGQRVLVFAAWRWSGPDGRLSPPDVLYLSVSATGTQ